MRYICTRNCNHIATYGDVKRESSIYCVAQDPLLTTCVLVDDKKNVSSNCDFRNNSGCRDAGGVRYEHDGSGWGEFCPNEDRRESFRVSGRAAEGRGIAGAVEFERAGEVAGGAEGSRGRTSEEVRFLAELGRPVRGARNAGRKPRPTKQPRRISVQTGIRAGRAYPAPALPRRRYPAGPAQTRR